MTESRERVNRATIRRGKLRVPDRDLHTTRLIGAGWTWDCTCGEHGPWCKDRDRATRSMIDHRVEKHPVG